MTATGVPATTAPPLAVRPSGPGRRVADVAVAAGVLVATAPAVPLLWAAIKLDSPGPMLFRQVRVGQGGRPFEILKLRTMVVDASRIGPSVGGSRDARITRLGRWLRATKLDEAPQLWNVVRGDMTLVGPRAEVPDLLVHYSDEQRGILAVKPGLTGAGQLHFTVHQADDLDGAEDPTAHHIEHQLGPKVALDLAYLRSQSWRTDLVLIAYTVAVMLGLRHPRFTPRTLRPGR